MLPPRTTRIRGRESFAMERYEDLEMESVSFDVEDVITDSIQLPDVS